MNNEELYIPKVKETEVRTGGTMAKGIGSRAVQGASMGAAAGPWGAAVGAAAGVTVGAIEQVGGMLQEKDQRAADKAMNTRYYNSMHRAPNKQRYQTLQAEEGMKSSRYQTVEVEGGKTVDAPGELVINTKTYDLRYDSTGDKPHEEGGKKITLGKDEAVINSQDDPDAYTKFKSAMMKYKLRKDPEAKRYMDDTIKALPTSEETKARYGMVKAATGLQQLQSDPMTDGNAPVPYEESLSSSGGGFNAGSLTSKIGQVGKYANVAHNLVKGMEEPDKVHRRYHGHTDRKYIDRSDNMKNAVQDQANATRRTLRGSGLSAGQRYNYNSSIASKAEQQLNTINTGEAQRADAINDQNQQRRQATQAINLDLANRYDEQDAQAVAATNDHTDKAVKESSQLAELGEQRQYMKNQDAAKGARDTKAIDGGTYDYGEFRFGRDGTSRKIIDGSNMTQEQKNIVNLENATNYLSNDKLAMYNELPTEAERLEFLMKNKHRMYID